MLSGHAGDSYDSSELLANLDGFDSPSANSGIPSQSNSPPATNEPEDKYEQPSINYGWGNDALIFDESDTDRISRLDGKRDEGTSGATQIYINGAHESDTVPHTRVDWQANKLVWCTNFFFGAYIY
jgi:hypothetical protein